MKTRKGYLPTDSIYPFRGLDTLTPSVQADPRTSPDCLNIDVVRGIIRKRRGYSYLGDTLTDPVIGIVEFESLAGAKTLLAFTTKKQYKWSGTAWTNITYQSAAVDVDWTGTEADWFDCAIVAGINGSATYDKWIIVTNGKDQPRYWDGTLSKFALYAPTGITNFKTCRTLSLFYDHLVLGNVSYTSGNPDRNVLYWSDTQKLLDFAGTNGGVALLSDIRGQIWKLLPLGDRLVVYGENSISTVTYVSGTQIYTFEKILDETRLVSARAVVNVGPFHAFLNQENAIMFDGSKLTRTLGDAIHRTYREELYVNERSQAFAHHEPAKQQVYFHVPTGVATAKIYKMEYDLENLTSGGTSWTALKYVDRATCMGVFSRNVTLTYDSTILAGVTYNQANFTYNQGTIKGGFPIRSFGTYSGRVALVDEILNSDAAAAVDAYWDTTDYTVPQDFQSVYARWIELEIECQGYEMEILYSKDEGRSYTSLTYLELTTSWKKYTIPLDVMSETLRFRFRNNCTNSGFDLRWGRVWLRPGGPT